VSLRENRCLIHNKHSLSYFCDVSVCHLLFFNVTFVDRITVVDWDRNDTIFYRRDFGEKLEADGTVLREEEQFNGAIYDGRDSRFRHILDEDEWDGTRQEGRTIVDQDSWTLDQIGGKVLDSIQSPSQNPPRKPLLERARDAFIKQVGTVILSTFASPQLVRSSPPPATTLPRTLLSADRDDYLHSFEEKDARFNEVIISTTSNDFETLDALYKVNEMYSCFYDPYDIRKLVFSRPSELWANLLLTVALAIILIVYMVGVPLFIIRKTAGWNNRTGYGKRMTQKMRSLFGMFSRYRYLDH